MSNHVFVLDTNRKPLTPCQPGVARSLLNAGKASVFRRYPFTIILNKEVEANPEPLELKLDPGSKVTGIALKQGNRIIFAAELQHRGQQMVEALRSRRQLREPVGCVGRISTDSRLVTAPGDKFTTVFRLAISSRPRSRPGRKLAPM